MTKRISSKIYAESFKSQAHLETILREAQAMVNAALTADEAVTHDAG